MPAVYNKNHKIMQQFNIKLKDMIGKIQMICKLTCSYKYLISMYFRHRDQRGEEKGRNEIPMMSNLLHKCCFITRGF